jgi:ABC-2 type transport system permease protein
MRSSRSETEASLAAAIAVAWREGLITRSYRASLALGVVGGLMQLVIYFYVSRTFKSQPVDALHGAPDYFAFAAVGAALTGVLAATGVSVAQRIREEQVAGTLELLVAQPVAVLPLALGYVGFPFLLAALRGTAYLLVGALLFGIDVANADWPGAGLVMLTTSGSLVALGTALGALTLLVKRTTSVVGLVLVGAGVLGGAYFPIAVLPEWLEPVASLMPTALAFDGLRSALFRGQGWVGDAVGLVAFAAVTLPLALWVFTLALRLTISRGTLSEY